MDAKAVYALTAKGRAELNAGTTLSPAELKLLVLVDGKLSAAQLYQQCAPLAPAEVTGMLGKLVKSGHIGHADDIATKPFEVIPATLDEESDAGLATLKQLGFFVRIARRAAKPRKLAAGERLTVLVVEDDPQLAKLLDMYLRMDHMQTRLAASRDAIVAAMNEKPAPDLVLLDLTLPDVDGLDVLSRMRQHPAVKDIPVIVCTARATRAAVLEGLKRGADGYVTKPFDVDVLHRAIQTVLGLP
jgi:CheY-like chemotaxis protein